MQPNRISMFIAAALVALLCLPVYSADNPQCVINADGSISCPELAPPVSATVDAAAAAEEEREAEAGRLTFRERRKLGLTFRNVLRTARQLNAAGELSSAEDVAAGQIAFAIAAESPKAYADPAVDWDAILAFLEGLMPIILQLIEIFNSFGQAVLPTVTTLADAVPIVAPPAMLAA